MEELQELQNRYEQAVRNSRENIKIIEYASSRRSQLEAEIREEKQRAEDEEREVNKDFIDSKRSSIRFLNDGLKPILKERCKLVDEEIAASYALTKFLDEYVSRLMGDRYSARVVLYPNN